MKLITYVVDGVPQPGLLRGEEAYDLAVVLEAVGEVPAVSLRALLETHGARLADLSLRIDDVLERTEIAPIAPLRDLRLAPPIADPAKVLCVGLNYATHVAETGRPLPEHPDLFAKFASTLIGASDEIGGSDITTNLDFEGEVAVVIGVAAHRVAEADALSVVAGYSILNDVTARDLQYRGTQWLAGKAVDGSTPFGPALVTADEVGDPQALAICTRLNGVDVQNSNTAYMIFPIAHIVSYVSHIMSLAPGDVIATGTPEGIGAKRKPPLWMRSGDVVEVEVEKLGILRSTVR
ncbi:fumarylacetoacetate hydrolase family protein [Micromonospora sp. NPDC048830]|uniref:fumarylacetoacetate hydrolase family protein n=1 Tax=Micromonospora sp. NPDC048830 TaxID=3364257 RepID=UPI0037131556